METGVLVQKLIDTINAISKISDYRFVVKKQYTSLARKLKLLLPLFEEIKDFVDQINVDTHGENQQQNNDHDEDYDDLMKSLMGFKLALDSAVNLLTFGSQGSRIYLVLEREQTMRKYQEISARLEQSLSGIILGKLDMSDEVMEQVDLVISQFRRAKGLVDPHDVDLFVDLISVYRESSGANTDAAVLRRLAEKLHLMDINDLKRESEALHEMVASKGDDPGGRIEKISMLLKKIKDFVLSESPDIINGEKVTPSSEKCQASNLKNSKSLAVPDDFRCPISLEMMRDPVTVSTGQTYERGCIEKWVEAGHVTCPKTQQSLTNLTLTPNYVLRSLISKWCESNGLESPKRTGNCGAYATTSFCTPAERAKVGILLRKLQSGNLEDQRSAAGELRLLAKKNADNRICITEAGAIPLLIGLLTTVDRRTQEHAVTALLNLSICEDNKSCIITSGALPGIVHVLKKGSMEGRENAAATLFSLSVLDANKATIGSSGAITPLVALLEEGSQRGKKDAATALFNLCKYQGNKGKAVRAGLAPALLKLLKEPGASMADESVAILSMLASHTEGKAAIGAADGALSTLVNLIGSGSPRNRENATSVLVRLCSSEQKHLIEAQELGIMGPLLDLAENGTERGKRKAAQLLECINRFIETRKLADAEATEHVQG
ncbi:hypothetical protein C5167_000819 [Papaver somniferum]|uniref:U-box domain-containing protein 12 n=1 Tax=Papaver somniferum TaxID=3469 RepID=A0A4Y7KQY0_PAPSO|nr:U-box domain-containing protein 13-like [Papaver somniferum]RZC75744.1 hypothetical protein C5167_000819 [Papaver somniferum]